MRPTKEPEPDDGMPAEYGMYDEYEDYDEDDFFYHMYFDEVSTTPLPDEFYDILESVSAGENTQQVSNYPDYFDYLLNRKAGKEPSDSEDAVEGVTETSSRLSKNNRYLQFRKRDSTIKSSKGLRRNSKFRRLKTSEKTKGADEESVLYQSRRNSKVMRHRKSEHLSSETSTSSSVKQRRNSKISRSKRASAKSKRTPKPKWNKNKWIRLRDRKRKKLERNRNRLSRDPRIIGILDRRVPALFRQNPFVTISLAKFVVLSTGVTTASVVSIGDISNVIANVVVKPISVIPPITVPTSSWTPDKWGTWPFITIAGVSASNITYLLVSLFILYVGIILYVDGDYLYNKVKEFAITRLSNVRRNVIKRVHTESGLNYLTDTLTSAWDAMKANFGVSPSATAPHGWIAQYSGHQSNKHPTAGGYYRRKYQKQRPYRKRRRKFFRKNQNSESDIYSSSNYRRTVPKQSTYSWGAEPPKSKNAGRNNWYRGDYQEDFEDSHDYQPSLDNKYDDSYYSEQDDYSYTGETSSSRRGSPEEEYEEEYEYDYEYTR